MSRTVGLSAPARWTAVQDAMEDVARRGGADPVVASLRDDAHQDHRPVEAPAPTAPRTR